ncbi:exo-alpha-sialidase, partial [Streptomyces sp. MBT62]|nr:exo-alpha-sialidase [Streptomyces sp. MBT62]
FKAALHLRGVIDCAATAEPQVALSADTVGVLYETGVTGTYDTIEFRRVPIAELG